MALKPIEQRIAELRQAQNSGPSAGIAPAVAPSTLPTNANSPLPPIQDRIRQLQQPTPTAISRPPEDGFVADILKSTKIPSALVQGYNFASGLVDTFQGDYRGAQEELEKTRDLPFLGKVAPIVRGDESYGEAVGKTLGAGVAIGSTIAPVGEGLQLGKAVAKTGIKQALKTVGQRGAGEVAKEVGAFGLSGAGQSAGEQMANEGKISRPGDVLATAVGTAVLGPAISIAGGKLAGTAGKAIKRIIAPGDFLADKATDTYSKVFNLGKSYVQKYETKPGKPGAISNMVDRAVEIGVPLYKDSSNFLRTDRALPVVEDVISQLDDRLTETLLTKDNKPIDFNNIKDYVALKIESSGKTPIEIEKQLAEANTMLASQEAKTGRLVKPSAANEDKRAYYRVGWDNNAPTSKETARIIGDAYKQAIESKFPDSPIVKHLNATMGEYLNLRRLLEDMDGKVVLGGKLGNQLMRLSGSIAGGKFGPLGSIAGYEIAGKFAEYLNDPARLTAKAFKQMQKAKVIPKYVMTLDEAKTYLKDDFIQNIITPEMPLGLPAAPPKVKGQSDTFSYPAIQLRESGIQSGRNNIATPPKNFDAPLPPTVPKTLPQEPRPGQVLLPQKATPILPPTIQMPSQAIMRGQENIARPPRPVAEMPAIEGQIMPDKLSKGTNETSQLEYLQSKAKLTPKESAQLVVLQKKEEQALGDVFKMDLPDFSEKPTPAINLPGEGVLQSKKAISRPPGLVNDNLPIIEGKVVDMPKKAVKRPKVERPVDVKQAEKFKDFDDLSTTILSKLKGRSTVSKQFISDLTNSADLKQSERDIIREVLKMEGDTVNVSNFANKVKSELLPLKVTESGEGGRYENITLPSEIRGSVSNYNERIYESPIKTSAGDIHFGGNIMEGDSEYAGSIPRYFGHTRIEDMADDKTRRVVEVQSDLYQKGMLEKSIGVKDKEYNSLFKKYADELGDPMKAMEKATKELANKNSGGDVAKLQQYNDPTAHFRMIREEVKKAAEDGKTKLQFPTGETAMKIEGLGGEQRWRLIDEKGNAPRMLQPEDLKVGQVADNLGDQWVVTDVLGDGKFKAVPKREFDKVRGTKSGRHTSQTDQEILQWMEKSFSPETVNSMKETFDISGKVDTNNPIYKFYEKDVGKYLRSKYNAQIVTDKNGVSWWEVPIKKEWAKLPVEAFGALPAIVRPPERKKKTED